MTPRSSLVKKLDAGFFRRPPEEVARELIGMELVRVFPSGSEVRGRIQEVAAFSGPARRASKGIYEAPGVISVSTKRGYNLIDIATEDTDVPSCVTLIGGVFYWAGEPMAVSGAGKLARTLNMGPEFHQITVKGKEFFIDPVLAYSGEILQRDLSGQPENFRGRFYVPPGKL